MKTARLRKVSRNGYRLGAGLLIAVLICGSQRGEAQMKVYNMTVVREYLEKILIGGNISLFDHYFGDSIRFNGHPIDSSGLAGMRESWLAAFPDLKFDIEDQFAAGDRVVTRLTFRGTHKGAFLGVAPTGRVVSYGAIAVDRLANGKVVEMWHEADMWGLFQQLTSDQDKGKN